MADSGDLLSFLVSSDYTQMKMLDNAEVISITRKVNMLETATC